MGPEHYFLEVPVYRCSRDIHQRDFERARATYAAVATSDAMRVRLQDHFELFKSSCWDYNEVLGWIRVYWLGFQIRSEYWFARGARHVRGGRRVYEWCGKAWESYVPERASSSQVFDLVREHLSTASREKPLRGRYLDTRAFERIGPHVDWRTFLKGQSE